MGGGRGEGGGGDYGANVNRNTPSFIILDYPRGKKNQVVTHILDSSNPFSNVIKDSS